MRLFDLKIFEKRREMMTTSTNDSQKNCADKNEPKEKGGVSGTDSKEFDAGDPLRKDPKPEKDLTTHPKTG